ncbi:hypothetical protein R1flu_021741 [Riccia fluitans]|uniref:Plastid division protein PDV2 n=1 Tax=Riccia fluitans TaxID=41844 RepID=A0ABD1ZQG4_9MARC
MNRKSFPVKESVLLIYRFGIIYGRQALSCPLGLIVSSPSFVEHRVWRRNRASAGWSFYVMEPDEIGVVLARASEIHVKISDSIERALRTEFLISTGGRSPSSGELESAALMAASGLDGSGTASGVGKGDKKDEVDQYEKVAAVGDGNEEARSLGAIRDALETLEEQLESLQAIQQQHRLEKDKALAELEESRRVLLRRLKEHNGSEWEVVHEALAFAGEPVEDRDDLPLPPYPMPEVNSSYPPAGEDQAPLYQMQIRSSGQMKRLSMGPGYRESIDGLNFKLLADESEDELLDEQEEGTPKSEQSRKPGRGFFASMFGHAFGLTTKAALVVVSVLAALAVSEVSHRLEKKRAGNGVSQQNPPSPPPPPPPEQVRVTPPPTVVRECPPGKKLIIEDGFPKCVVKERVELPFPREIKNPDVLYGRG